MNWQLVMIIFLGCSTFTTLNAMGDVLSKLLAPIRGIKGLARLQDVLVTPLTEVAFANKRPSEKEYDFIVVGSGPSGCVITNRLTENRGTTVLLLEAGFEDNVITDIPVFNPYTVLTDYNWAFPTEYSGDTCLGLYGKICPWPAGKGSGGGTILNAMIYTRGNYRDFDSWAAEGNPGWSYRDVLPYFNKIERMTIPELQNSSYHGTSGYLSISYVPFLTPLYNAFMEAGSYFGYKQVDYNNPKSHIGFAPIQSTTFQGQRVSASTAYLKPILKRSNFQISMKSRVSKVLIDPRTKRAFGVIYIKNGKQWVVRARKEVILAAGAFNSPQILMLSGIGHAYHLRDMKIPVLQDLPVGDNLMEHVGMHGLSFLVNKKVSLRPLELLKDNLIPSVLEYIFKKRGVLTSLGCEAVAYMKTKYSNSSSDYPDIELLFIPSGMNNDAGIALRKTFGISDEVYDFTYRAFDGKDAFSIWPMLLYPQSRGYVRLKDSNPLSKVRIWHNFLKETIDLKILVEAIKTAIALTRAPTFQKYGARLLNIPFPQCVNIAFGTDKYWECAVRSVTTQFHHQSGTCKMGSVVDSRLRVFGISGLRVADASIMPTITGGHTQAPAYMIGEKAADLIKEDWSLF